jgi:hypothetical protein
MYRRVRARVWPTLLGVDLLNVPDDISQFVEFFFVTRSGSGHP